MKIYNLNIDTSKPVNQAMQMQQNETGLLNPKITNGGQYIRNLTTKVYDGETEVPSTENGFKVEVGTEPKHVKVVAKSTPVECIATTYVGGSGAKQSKAAARFQLAPGVYSQDEFMTIAQKFTDNSGSQLMFYANAGAIAACGVDRFTSRYTSNGIIYWFTNSTTGEILPPDQDLVVSAPVEFYQNQYTFRNATASSYTYPAFGEYTDYQMDTTIKPSSNAPYDGNYVEPLEEAVVEFDGVKFVPTTMTIDGVVCLVLAEAQEVDSTDTDLDSTDTELDSTDSEVTNGDGE